MYKFGAFQSTQVRGADRGRLNKTNPLPRNNSHDDLANLNSTESPRGATLVRSRSFTDVTKFANAQHKSTNKAQADAGTLRRNNSAHDLSNVNRTAGDSPRGAMLRQSKSFDDINNVENIQHTRATDVRRTGQSLLDHEILASHSTRALESFEDEIAQCQQLFNEAIAHLGRKKLALAANSTTGNASEAELAALHDYLEAKTRARKLKQLLESLRQAQASSDAKQQPRDMERSMSAAYLSNARSSRAGSEDKISEAGHSLGLPLSPKARSPKCNNGKHCSSLWSTAVDPSELMKRRRSEWTSSFQPDMPSTKGILSFTLM